MHVLAGSACWDAYVHRKLSLLGLPFHSILGLHGDFIAGLYRDDGKVIGHFVYWGYIAAMERTWKLLKWGYIELI